MRILGAERGMKTRISYHSARKAWEVKQPRSRNYRTGWTVLARFESKEAAEAFIKHMSSDTPSRNQ